MDDSSQFGDFFSSFCDESTKSSEEDEHNGVFGFLHKNEMQADCARFWRSNYKI